MPFRIIYAFYPQFIRSDCDNPIRFKTRRMKCPLLSPVKAVVLVLYGLVTV